MNNSMRDLVSKVSVGKGRSETAKEYARSAEWPTCFNAVCPLQATIKADNATSTYHYRKHGLHPYLNTDALKE